MTLRTGFVRLGRVTAVAYWLLAAIVVGLVSLNVYQAAQSNPFDQFVRAPDPDKPWEAYWHPYNVEIAGQRVGFLEPDEKALDADVKLWVKAHPPQRPLKNAAEAAGASLAIAALGFGLAWLVVRALWWVALGFADKSHH